MVSNTSDERKYPVRPIIYTDDDVLWLENGLPCPIGNDLYPGCIVFFDSQPRSVSGILIDAASEQLLPALTGRAVEQPGDDNGEFPAPEILYIPEEDVLWLRNGFPALDGMELFPGCTVFLEGQRGNVSGIRFDSAKEMLLPFLLRGGLGS